MGEPGQRQDLIYECVAHEHHGSALLMDKLEAAEKRAQTGAVDEADQLKV